MPSNESNPHDTRGESQVGDLLKLRFEYAWGHFEYHARQRMIMFHFFLIITGVLANAYVLLIRESLLEMGTGLAVVAAFICGGFIALDWRNAQLVKMGEEVLRKLEEEKIFTEDFKAGKDNQGHQLGFLYREAEEERLRTAKRDADSPPLKRMLLWLWDNRVKHKLWIRAIEIIVGVSFILAALVPIFYPEIVQVEKKGGPL